MKLDTILLGDSYKLIKDIPDNSVDCIYTDVPYLYVYGGAGKDALGQRMWKRKKELNDLNLRIGFDYSILNDFIRIMKKVNIIIWFSKWQMLEILNYFMSLDKEIYFELMTWEKLNPPPLTNNSWLSDLEYCYHFREKGVILNDGYNLKSKTYRSAINKVDKDLYNHPTIKPLDLVKRHLLHTTQPNDIVFDPFIGSGTTAVACKEIDRHFIGIEIDPEYHKIAVDRVNGITASGQTSIFTDFEAIK